MIPGYSFKWGYFVANGPIQTMSSKFTWGHIQSFRNSSSGNLSTQELQSRINYSNITKLITDKLLQKLYIFLDYNKIKQVEWKFFFEQKHPVLLFFHIYIVFIQLKKKNERLGYERPQSVLYNFLLKFWLFNMNFAKLRVLFENVSLFRFCAKLLQQYTIIKTNVIPNYFSKNEIEFLLLPSRSKHWGTFWDQQSKVLSIILT